MTSDIQQAPFVKQLAANDRPTRDKAVESLKTYLSGRRELPPIELLKLWKGLFYCMWMSDRPRTQAALAVSLAELVAAVPKPTTIPFLRAFWLTMQREWTNIDVLRMEKFLLLTRRYLGATFGVLKARGWEEGLVTEHMDLLREIPCNLDDIRIPNGMRFHVIDIYVDELEKVETLVEDDDEDDLQVQKTAVLELLLAPLRTMAKDSPTKAVRSKAKEALMDDRLPGNEKDEEMTKERANDYEWGGIED